MNPQRPLPDLADGGPLQRFFRGAACAATGISLVFGHRRLLLLALVPMAVHVALFLGLVVAGFSVAGDLATRVTPDSWTSLFGISVASIITVAVGVVTVLAALIGAVFLGSVVCDPFYDVLSERTEQLLLGKQPSSEPASLSSIVMGIVRELWATTLRLSLWAAGTIILWLLSLTPAAVVAIPASFLWAWVFVAYEYLSRSLARHAVDPGQRLRPVVDNKALCIGFGAAGWLLSFIPLTAPFLVVGATHLYLCLWVHGRAGSHPAGGHPAVRGIARAA